jgi:hypothetical protein
MPGDATLAGCLCVFLLLRGRQSKWRWVSGYGASPIHHPRLQVSAGTTKVFTHLLKFHYPAGLLSRFCLPGVQAPLE